MEAKFIWDDLNVNVVQSPLIQNQDQCAFTGIARQLEYELRLQFAQAGYQLHPGQILDHKSWQILDHINYGLEPGTYFLYQDSLKHYYSSDHGVRGLFHNCIGILDPQLINLCYYGISKIPNFMWSVAKVKEKKADFDAKLHNKRKDIADLAKFRENQQT